MERGGRRCDIDGVRLRGRKEGFEAGLNTGIGAEMNGEGLHAGAQTKATFGSKGISTSAKATATAGRESALSAARAGVRYNGNHYAQTAATTNRNVRIAKDKYEYALKERDEAKKRRVDAKAK